MTLKLRKQQARDRIDGPKVSWAEGDAVRRLSLTFTRREFQFCSMRRRVGISDQRYHPVHEE
jgi:hypothetical protein